MARYAHVIDGDSRRRARIFSDLRARDVHAEIYESLEEFRQTKPNNGFLFAADDKANHSPAEIVRTLNANGTALPLVVYANQPTTEMVVSAMLSGALDYLEWPFNLDRLDLAFQRMDAEGEQLQGRAHRRFAATIKVRKLTRRERDVLLQIARGLSNRQIADALRISYRTVEIHRANMMHKLNAQTAADAARIALYAGLDEDY